MVVDLCTGLHTVCLQHALHAWNGSLRSAEAGCCRCCCCACRSVNIMKWKCYIPGKANTDWDGGFYPLSMEFSEDYPAKPPKVTTANGQALLYCRSCCSCRHAVHIRLFACMLLCCFGWPQPSLRASHVFFDAAMPGDHSTQHGLHGTVWHLFFCP
eukprot:GHRQ01039476.1.p1 GENE.GHRQ01039476.1~~GHRQ01039476.1.p1  ORF type:complete len:156 (-),score=32.52 GHRQ01039476.1:65-532(-)